MCIRDRINIVGCPTIRENNKIALSTRNELLNKSSIKKASKIAIKLDNFKSKYRLFIAYYINGIRLIDNF